jgi:hypothetical protein
VACWYDKNRSVGFSGEIPSLALPAYREPLGDYHKRGILRPGYKAHTNLQACSITKFSASFVYLLWDNVDVHHAISVPIMAVNTSNISEEPRVCLVTIIRRSR